MDRSYVGDDHFGGPQPYNARKRGAEDAFEVQSGISNHFKKLRLNNAPPHFYTVERPHAPSTPTDRDLMPVDETPSKVYIHDLAAEIAQIEAEEPKDMFLLDLDKKVSALPAKLFLNSAPDPNTQLVLYREPSSISVPPEEDAVRKAIIEARRRVREKQKAERENEEEQGRINGNRRFWPDEIEQEHGNGTDAKHVVNGVEPNAVEENFQSDQDLMDID